MTYWLHVAEAKGDLPRAAGFFKTAAESARNAKTPGAREAKAHVARFAENGHCVSVIPSISEEESRRTHERLAGEGSVLSQRVLGMREARDVLESQTELRTDAERSARLERSSATRVQIGHGARVSAPFGDATRGVPVVAPRVHLHRTLRIEPFQKTRFRDRERPTSLVVLRQTQVRGCVSMIVPFFSSRLRVENLQRQ